MRRSLTSRIQCAAGLGAAVLLALTLSACSSSVGDGSAAASTTASATASASARSSDNAGASADPSGTASSDTASSGGSDSAGSTAGANPLASYPMEGAAAQWTSVVVGGETHDALVPSGRGGGSIVWKQTSDIAHLTFVAAVPDGSTVTAPVIVKVVTGDNRPPVVAEVSAGSPQTLDVDTASASVVKVVWSVEGRPGSGADIAFYDFTVER